MARVSVIGDGEYVNLVLTRYEFGALELSSNLGPEVARKVLTPVGKSAQSRVLTALREAGLELADLYDSFEE